MGQQEPLASWPQAAVAGGAALSVAALALARILGPPYLDLGSLNPFIGVFAISFFAALFAVPFAANGRLQRSHPERAESWEPAMLIWGAIALALMAASALLVVPGGFSGSQSLADAAAVLALIEAGLVVLVLAAWVLAG